MRLSEKEPGCCHPCHHPECAARPQPPRPAVRAGACPDGALLEMDLGALALGGEAGDGPHLDLDARVKLLVPHVPDALDRGGDRFILQTARCSK